MSRQYLTTAIDYANAAPHMGHVMEKVLADVCARWMRLRGDEVLFQIGMDEHGVKVQRTAAEQSLAPRALVDRMAPLYRDLFARLHVSHDRFIRTSDRAAHWPTVAALWGKLADAGMLEKRSYRGLYCSGCEQFLTARDLEDGMCPHHQRAPEEVTEENWFFLLSKKQGALRKLLAAKKGGYRIIPASRARETLALLDEGLTDVAFSRPVSSLSWGVPVPGDTGQTMYVWCDALTNYLSGLGFFTDREERAFWDDAEVTRVSGKDIPRFHALIWPAMLSAAGVRAPDRLLVHGFLTCDGRKMSKTIGNVVVPGEVLDRFGGDPDPLRLYLSGIPVGSDGDFSWERIGDLYDGVLRNKIGNLLNRVLAMLAKEGGVIVPLAGKGDVPWEDYRKAMDAFEYSEALKIAVAFADAANTSIDRTKPWALPTGEKRRELAVLAEHVRHLSLMLLPFIPGTAGRMLAQLGLGVPGVLPGETAWGAKTAWKAAGAPEILFRPLE